MTQHYPVLIIVVPLLTAFIVTWVGWLNQKAAFPLSVAGLGVSLAAAVLLLPQVLEQQLIVYKVAGWDPPWGIALNIDSLNILVLIVITTVGLVNLIATRRSVEDEFPDKIVLFYTLYLLFVTGLCGIVATGDAFNLYVLLEIASLTGYALIGMGEGRAPLAGLNYIFMGTIGASLYLLGIGYIYLVTGTLNMADIAGILPGLYHSKVVMFAFGICIVGLFLKMAFFPFHAWLPNAYSFSPSPSVGLIAPLTTKVMIYVMIRVTLYVFTPAFVFDTLHVADTVVWLAAGAIVAGSLFALAEKRLKRMLTYIIVAEVGYMVGGFWLGNRLGITGAILHIINDAMMTLCVFLAAGCIAYRTGDDAFESLQGLFRKMPFTMGAFVVGAMAIIGVPPTCGFFSKWYLISGGIAAGQYGFVAALLFSSLVNVILFFRIFEIAYFEPFADHHGHGGHEAEGIREAPLSMLVPLSLVALLLIVLGIYSGDIVTKVIDFAIPAQIV